jgi:diaminopimelate epimerase
MELAFTKMHGLGNDFVVFDAIHQKVDLEPGQIRHIADRHFGVGCDQVLLVEPPRTPGTQFHYRIFNADGGEVEQCGNGARCFARFVRDRGLTHRDEIDVGTATGAIRLHVEPDGQVRVNMGAPRLEPAEIPFDAARSAPSYRLERDGEVLEFGAVSMGNPHAVFVVEDVALAPVEVWGPWLQAHASFPRGVNVGFMAVRDRRDVALRVYERGAGETLACGTGACAAVVSGRVRGLLDPVVRVNLPGGTLVISWDGPEEPVWMTGPAERVFEGRLTL